MVTMCHDESLPIKRKMEVTQEKILDWINIAWYCNICGKIKIRSEATDHERRKINNLLIHELREWTKQDINIKRNLFEKQHGFPPSW